MNSEGWEKSLKTLVEQGKKGWVSRETDKEAKRFKIYIERDIVQEPEWWGGNF